MDIPKLPVLSYGSPPNNAEIDWLIHLSSSKYSFRGAVAQHHLVFSIFPIHKCWRVYAGHFVLFGSTIIHSVGSE